MAKSKLTEFVTNHTSEFSQGQLVLSKEGGFGVILVTDLIKDSFEGVVIYGGCDPDYPVGFHSVWSKHKFKPFYGSVTLTEE